jgi:2,3-bisphosphoglycerate-dependent phosphoglycerate mutase
MKARKNLSRAKSGWRPSCARTCGAQGAGPRGGLAERSALRRSGPSPFPIRIERLTLRAPATEGATDLPTLILVRHGQSQWNLENRFTGWWDVDLTDKGVAEATPPASCWRQGRAADLCLHLAPDPRDQDAASGAGACGRLWIPETKDWRLNERHYGGLTGLDKAETAAKHGDEQVKIWRRSFDVPPPDWKRAANSISPPTRAMPGSRSPNTESLKLTIERVLPYWESAILPVLAAARR